MTDWQVNDLALCVSEGGTCPDCGRASNAVVGGVYTVKEYGSREFSEGDLSYLLFAELPDEHREGPCWTFGYDERCFRKIAPHEPDAEDAATIYELIYAPSPVFSGDHRQ